MNVILYNNKRQSKQTSTIVQTPTQIKATPILLVSDPLPAPNTSRPSSIKGSMYAVPLYMAPVAKRTEPTTHSNEKKIAPTGINKHYLEHDE